MEADEIVKISSLLNFVLNSSTMNSFISLSNKSALEKTIISFLIARLEEKYSSSFLIFS